mmetsp:Transcript_55129/g.130008  ORF Transcript_55129/g.130008 Transcript_55129/m.130008 type:complete len:155 (+) Transcript_55129:300-764(+)
MGCLCTTRGEPRSWVQMVAHFHPPSALTESLSTIPMDPRSVQTANPYPPPLDPTENRSIALMAFGTTPIWVQTAGRCPTLHSAPTVDLSGALQTPDSPNPTRPLQTGLRSASLTPTTRHNNLLLLLLPSLLLLLLPSLLLLLLLPSRLRLLLQR